MSAGSTAGVTPSTWAWIQRFCAGSWLYMYSGLERRQ